MRKVMPRYLLAVAVAALLLSACAQEPVIDGSSEAGFETSLEQIAEKMSKKERDQFSEALFRLMAYEIARLDDEWAKTPDRPVTELPDMYAPFDGMTPTQVIQQASELQAVYEAAQHKSAAQAAREQLDGSSQKAFLASFRAIATTLTPVELDQFSEALLAIALAKKGEHATAVEQLKHTEIFDGMRREQVLKDAENIASH